MHIIPHSSTKYQSAAQHTCQESPHCSVTSPHTTVQHKICVSSVLSAQQGLAPGVHLAATKCIVAACQVTYEVLTGQACLIAQPNLEAWWHLSWYVISRLLLGRQNVTSMSTHMPLDYLPAMSLPFSGSKSLCTLQASNSSCRAQFTARACPPGRPEDERGKWAGNSAKRLLLIQTENLGPDTRRHIF